MPGKIEPNSDVQVLDQFMKYRAVGLGKIEGKTSFDLMMRLTQLQFQSNDPIHLLIDSPGGLNQSAMEIHDHIRHFMTAPVNALVMGLCASAATFVLLACNVRRTMPHATFVVHSGTMSDISFKIDKATPKNAERLLNETRKSREWMIEFYMRHLKMRRKQVLHLIARGDEQFDNALTAEEALRIGLVTEIVKGKAGIFPEPTH